MSPMLLMGEWAKSFHTSLKADDSTKGIAGLIGLPDDANGFAFETAVGNYLRHLSSLEGMEQYVRVGNVRDPNRDTYVEHWLRDSKQHGEAFKLALWRSVWDTFGPARVDALKAASAYGMLLGLLQASAGAVVFSLPLPPPTTQAPPAKTKPPPNSSPTNWWPAGRDN